LSNLHRIEGHGNLVRTPELRYLPSGQAVLSVTVAVDETYTKDGEQKGQAYFWDLSFFGPTAEKVAERNYQKGDSVWFEGTPDIGTYEARDGSIRIRTKVRFPRCFKTSSSRNGNGNGNYHAADPESELETPKPAKASVATLDLDDEEVVF
jgi:single-strand DNA-binding protein